MKNIIKHITVILTASFLIISLNGIYFPTGAAASAPKIGDSSSQASFNVRKASEELNTRGLKSFENKDYPNAISEFEKALELSPDYDEAKYNLALSRYMNADYLEAISDLKTILKNDPNFNEARIYLLQSYLDLIKHKAAKGDETAAKSLVEEVKSLEFASSDFVSLAINAAENGIKKDTPQMPASAPPPPNTATQDSVQTGLIEELKKAPESSTVHDKIRRALESKNASYDAKALEAALNDCVETNSRNVEAHVSLGDIYMKSGDMERAGYHYEMALLAEPQNLYARRKHSEAVNAQNAAAGKKSNMTAVNAAESAIDEYDILKTQDSDEINIDYDDRLSTTIVTRLSPDISNSVKKVEQNPFEIEELKKATCYHIAKKNYKKAENIIMQAFAIDPSDNETNYLSAYIKLKLKKKQDALPFIMSINADTLSNAKLLHDIGVLLVRLKKHNEAVKFFTAGIEADRTFLDNYISLSIYYTQINDFNSARKYFEEALVISPDNPKTLYFFALMNKRNDNYEDFMTLSTKLLNSAPNDGYSKKIRRHMGLTPGDRLISYDNEKTLLDVAINYMNAGEFERAEAKLKDIVKINPNYYDALLSLSRTAKKQSKTLEYASYLLKLNALKPNAVFELEIGRAFFELGLNSLAREYYVKYINKNPLDTPVKIEYATRLKENGAYISAKTICDSISQRARTPEESEAANAVANGIDAGDLSDTVEAAFNTIKDAARENLKKLYKNLYENEMYLAIEGLSSTLGASGAPIESSVMEYYAMALMQLKRYNKAIDVYKAIIENERENHLAYLQLGKIYMKRNNFVRAEEYLRAALIFKPKDSEALLMLGDACLYQKNFEDAEVSYSEAFECSPNALIKEEVKMKLERLKLKKGLTRTR